MSFSHLSSVPVRLSHRHALLLKGYTVNRNKSQVQKAIDYQMGVTLNMGRHVLPLTQELLDWDLIERTNVEAPDSQGHYSLITNRGLEELKNYLERFNSISDSNPEFGF